MRFFIIAIGLAVLAGIMVTVIVTAATSDITATVTAQEVSLYIDDGVIAFGTLATSGRASTTSDNLDDSQAVGNTGNVTGDFAVQGQDSANWTLETAIGTNQYTLRVSTTTSDTTPRWKDIPTTPTYLDVESKAAQSTSTMDFAIQVPSGTTFYNAQSVDITVQISAQ